jgi:hypothetical protein
MVTSRAGHRFTVSPEGRTGIQRAEPAPNARRIRVCYFNAWAAGLEPAAEYAERVSSIDLSKLVSNPSDPGLMTKARLDCDWYGENTRVFASMRHSGMEILPAWVCGLPGLLEFAGAAKTPGEERWLVTMGHQPQALGTIAGRIFALLSAAGVRHLYYAFDEASRFMACFRDIAPHLDVLIHDEKPLADAARAQLRKGCLEIHRSWVANIVPWSVPFNEAPDDRILFLGSQLGLTPHRKCQMDFLHRRYGERFVAICDHSVAVASRATLNRFLVGFCPEGRKFATPAMALTHTDRPFWSGCSGLVPVAEDSQTGGRLEELHRDGLIARYDHADLESLGAACDRAFAMSPAQRRRIYDHFNSRETVGTVVADALSLAV